METATTSAHALNHALRSAVADLEQVNSWAGLWRFAGIGALFLSCVWLAWSAAGWPQFVGYTAAAGFLYAFWFVCTHDMVHYTLTGWKWFDEWMPRLISYPMLWPFGTYAQLHRLHHAWNGIDLRDPERVQWTAAEYQQANSLQQWYVRHQWYVDILVFSGLGLIAKTIYKGLRLRPQFPVLSHTLLWDGLGILAVQISMVVVAIWHDRLVQYLLFWLILERIIGILMQARDHLEHYGLWHTERGHQLTQIYACRNLNTPALASWLMGGLNLHAVHHVFPSLPFNHLPEAFDRMQAVLIQHDLPLMAQADGYIAETLRLSAQTLLIDECSACLHKQN